MSTRFFAHGVVAYYSMGQRRLDEYTGERDAALPEYWDVSAGPSGRPVLRYDSLTEEEKPQLGTIVKEIGLAAAVDWRHVLVLGDIKEPITGLVPEDDEAEAQRESPRFVPPLVKESIEEFDADVAVGCDEGVDAIGHEFVAMDPGVPRPDERPTGQWIAFDEEDVVDCRELELIDPT